MPPKASSKSMRSKNTTSKDAVSAITLRRSKRRAPVRVITTHTSPALEKGETEEETRPTKRRRTVKNEETVSQTMLAEKNPVEVPIRTPRKAGHKAASKAPKDANTKPSQKDDATKRSQEGVTTKNTGASYWLMKAEPNSRVEKGVDVKFSIDDLQAATEPEPWEGVRNHVAKKNMMAMKKGDLAFFYHSNCKVPGIAGMMEVVRESSIDASAFNSNHPYYDPKSSPEVPRWYHVHVSFVRKFPALVTLKTLQNLKADGVSELQDMQLLRQSRLSVSKVMPSEWEFIMGLVESLEAESLEAEGNEPGPAAMTT